MTTLTIPVLYEDTDLLVLDKPAGVAVHADDYATGETVVDWLVANRPEVVGVGESMTLASGHVVERPGIVHRLDRDTSGVLVVAKTVAAFASLKEQFKNHTLKKVYRAIGTGNLKADSGVVDLPIGRSASDPRQRVASAKAMGTLREAKTAWRILERFTGYLYLELEPATGRTHQIRAHLKAIGCPVLGDTLYNTVASKLPVQAPRLMLHAYQITLQHPTTGQPFSAASPVSADFSAVLDNLRAVC